MSDFDEESYVGLLNKYYNYNILGLDLFIFIINILLFIINPIVSGLCLILQLISFIISKEACDLGIGKKYDKSGPLFDIVYGINISIYILTIVNIILGAL